MFSLYDSRHEYHFLCYFIFKIVVFSTYKETLKTKAETHALYVHIQTNINRQLCLMSDFGKLLSLTL